MTRAAHTDAAAMLFLLFELDGDRYALEATQIAEVLPLVATKAIPAAPAWVAGIVMHRGTPVPVIDVPRLALGRPARPLRSTRLVLVRYCADPGSGREFEADASRAGGGGQLLGLVVERATRTARIDTAAFQDSGIATPNARWLGPVAQVCDEGVVQRVDVQQMLGADVRTLLYDYASMFADEGDETGGETGGAMGRDTDAGTSDAHSGDTGTSPGDARGEGTR